MKVTEDTIEVVKEHFRKVFDYVGLDLEDEISEIAEDDEEVCVDIGSVETNFDIAEFLIKTEKIESLSYDDYCVRCGSFFNLILQLKAIILDLMQLIFMNNLSKKGCL